MKAWPIDPLEPGSNWGFTRLRLEVSEKLPQGLTLAKKKKNQNKTFLPMKTLVFLVKNNAMWVMVASRHPPTTLEDEAASPP